MAKDSPKLGGYQIVNPPDDMKIYPEVINQMNELADGGYRQRILGYRIRATLNWDDNWIRSQDLTGLIAVANDLTGASGTGNGALTFVPMPDTKPSLTYAVIWKNKFEFNFHAGRHGVYNGTIELVSATPTATITDLP